MLTTVEGRSSVTGEVQEFFVTETVKFGEPIPGSPDFLRIPSAPRSVFMGLYEKKAMRAASSVRPKEPGVGRERVEKKRQEQKAAANKRRSAIRRTMEENGLT